MVISLFILFIYRYQQQGYYSNSGEYYQQYGGYYYPPAGEYGGYQYYQTGQETPKQQPELMEEKPLPVPESMDEGKGKGSGQTEPLPPGDDDMECKFSEIVIKHYYMSLIFKEPLTLKI